jgi:hypothetical protein
MGLKQGIFNPQHPEKCKGKLRSVYRSGWELTFMRFLDTNSGVVEWSSESLPISYFNPVKNKICRYYPDFLVKYKGKDGEYHIELIEIKPYRETQPPKIHGNKKQSTLLMECRTWSINQAKWEAAKKFCEQRGITFRLMTEKELKVIR